jgi:formylglycine-generating enzyme required for sulfatase activity
MTITVECPNAACKKRLTAKEKYAGKVVKCPACGQPMRLPAPNVAAVAPVNPRASRQEKNINLDLGGGVTLALTRIPAGKFMMGSPDSEKGHFDGEGPQHEVTLSKPFYMGVTEVTQAQYEAVMDTNPSNFRGETNPVETVSWDDATEFCKKLSEKTRQAVRLPTEAEWEYACRAGTATAFSFGDADSALGDYAWYSANSGNTTHPVGQKKPNAWGLYDMNGNVWEWCADWYGYGYGDYTNGAVRNPQGAGSGGLRVLRGGSWRNGAGSSRAAFRFFCTPDFRHYFYGFRVVVSVAGVDLK